MCMSQRQTCKAIKETRSTRLQYENSSILKSSPQNAVHSNRVMRWDTGRDETLRGFCNRLLPLSCTPLKAFKATDFLALSLVFYRDRARRFITAKSKIIWGWQHEGKKKHHHILNVSFSCFTTDFKIGGLEKLWQETEIKKKSTLWEHSLPHSPSKPIELNRLSVREVIQINSIKLKWHI